MQLAHRTSGPSGRRPLPRGIRRLYLTYSAAAWVRHRRPVVRRHRALAPPLRHARQRHQPDQRGWFANSSTGRIYKGFLGGDSTWQSAVARRAHVPADHARRAGSKLAFWVLGDLVTGGTAPYLDLPDDWRRRTLGARLRRRPLSRRASRCTAKSSTAARSPATACSASSPSSTRPPSTTPRRTRSCSTRWAPAPASGLRAAEQALAHEPRHRLRVGQSRARADSIWGFRKPSRCH